MTGIKTITDLAFESPSVVPVYVESTPSAVQGVVPAAGTNGASTGIATDYTFAWSTPTVNHVLLQNNTAAVVNYDIDQAASAGTLTLAAGAAIFLDITMSVLHLFTAASQTVNGAAAAGIVVRAWQ